MSQALRAACQEIFRETFWGVEVGKNYTYYVQGRESVLNSIASLTPDQASRQIPGSRATIGAHANHLCYYLHLFNATCRGQEEDGDWEGSWAVQTFDEDSWNKVMAMMAMEYEEAHAWYRDFDGEISDNRAIYMIANIAHAAFHLGAMRALIPMVLATD